MRNEKFGYQAYCSLNSVLKQVEMEGTGYDIMKILLFIGIDCLLRNRKY